MKLLWKLLRKHISIPQLTGFFLSNLLGLFIVLFSFQFYRDVHPVFSQDEGLIKPEYLIVSKRVSGVGILGGAKTLNFSSSELDELRGQSFCRSLGAFTASQYRVSCNLGLEGLASFGTEMFFESVPDSYVDVDLSQWSFCAENPEIPIVLPRSYLAIYNFGFAQSQSLPKLSEGLVGMVKLIVTLRGNGLEESFPAKVVGFSNRLNTILVPDSFIQWSNKRFSADADTSPTRLILEVHNPTDDKIVAYMNEKGYELEDDKLDSGKATYFLKITSFVLLGIGLLICALSFYVLLLSIYLLVQKNTEKLRNLLLIGYTPQKVALPYQLLSISVNMAVLLASFGMLYAVRRVYMQVIWDMFPSIQEATMLQTLMLGGVIFFSVSALNSVVIYKRVMDIWFSKE